MHRNTQIAALIIDLFWNIFSLKYMNIKQKYSSFIYIRCLLKLLGKILSRDLTLSIMNPSRSSRRAWLWPRHCLFFSPFLFSQKREEEKENELAKIVIKSHVFLIDHPSIQSTKILLVPHKCDSFGTIKICIKRSKSYKVLFWKPSHT